MHRNALLAAEWCERSATIIDSRSAAAWHGLVTLAAAEAAAEDAGRRAELVACLESLEFLRQSGHVPAIALGLAGHLQVRPVFRMRGGAAERMGLRRSERAALERIAKAWREGCGPDAPPPAIFHAGRPDRADELAMMVGGRRSSRSSAPRWRSTRGPASWGRPGCTRRRRIRPSRAARRSPPAGAHADAGE
jgi:fatty acid-binding protein DegV